MHDFSAMHRFLCKQMKNQSGTLHCCCSNEIRASIVWIWVFNHVEILESNFVSFLNEFSSNFNLVIIFSALMKMPKVKLYEMNTFDLLIELDQKQIIAMVSYNICMCLKWLQKYAQISFSVVYVGITFGTLFIYHNQNKTDTMT